MKRVSVIFCVLFTALVCCCYVSDSQAAMRSHVIGGQPSNLPQLAAVYYTQDGVGYVCSGTVVSSTAVLTAAHCAGGTGYVVVVNDDAVSATVLAVAPGYDPSANYVDDVAIVELGKATDVTPMPVSASTAVAGSRAELYGWGETDQAGGGAGTQGMMASVVVQPVAGCEAFWRSYWASSDMCALDPASSASIAPGDSGGPLVVDGQIVGIGDRMAPGEPQGDPSIFTRVDQLYGWIEAELGTPVPTAVPVVSVKARPRVKHARVPRLRYHWGSRVRW